MRSTAFAAMLAALTLTGGMASAQQVVRIATEGAYPPWNFINEQNEIDGFERAFGDAMCERAGLTCEWVLNDWDSIIPGLVSGNYDAIMAGMSVTAAREEVIAFSEWYLPPDPARFIALASSGVDDLDAALEGIVGAQVNTVHAGNLAERGANIAEFATPEDMVAAVRSGVVDSGFFDTAFLDPIVEASNGELVYITEDLFIANGIGVGLRQSDTALRETLNATIIAMKADGTINTLITEWFGENFPTFE